jgi:heat shock protein HtpX
VAQGVAVLGDVTAIALRTALLMAALIALLGIGGWAFAGSNGLVVMVIIGLAINFGAYWFSDRIALLAHRAPG